MKDDHATNSHNLKSWEDVLFELDSERVKPQPPAPKSVHLAFLPVQSASISPMTAAMLSCAGSEGSRRLSSLSEEFRALISGI